MNNLETILTYYKDQRKTLGSHLVAFGASTALAALASKLGADASGESDAASSLVGTLSAMGVYWPTFIGGLILRDRKELKDASGIRWSKVKERALEYASWFGAGEAIYAGVRGGIHAYLQHEGRDPEVASAIADSVTASAYTLGLPFIQIGMDHTKNYIKRILRVHS